MCEINKRQSLLQLGDRSMVWLCCLLFTVLSVENLLAAPQGQQGSGNFALRGPGGGSPPGNAGPPQEDGVERVEMEDLKEVDGHPVRTVEGHYSYQSPEGLPVYVMYMADETGNKASFRIGLAVAGKGGGGSSSGGSRPGVGPGGSSAGGAGGGGKGVGDKSYLPPNKQGPPPNKQGPPPNRQMPPPNKQPPPPNKQPPTKTDKMYLPPKSF